MKKNNKYNNIYIAIIIYIIMLYITISLVEWCAHYYIMHENGFISSIINKYETKEENTHIEHHKKTYLTQYNTGPEVEMVFSLFQQTTILLTIILLILFSIFWYIIPYFRFSIPYKNYIIIVLIIILFYYRCWGSMHSRYHNRKIEIYNQISYNLVPYFIPNTNLSIYKYLFMYHSLHHLNKGESKGNYNIICPLFDYVFQTYTPRVDNTLHFSKNKPITKQEIWLSKNQVFDIRICDNNQVKYKLENSNEWLLFPYDI